MKNCHSQPRKQKKGSLGRLRELFTMRGRSMPQVLCGSSIIDRRCQQIIDSKIPEEKAPNLTQLSQITVRAMKENILGHMALHIVSRWPDLIGVYDELANRMIEEHQPNEQQIVFKGGGFERWEGVIQGPVKISDAV